MKRPYLSLGLLLSTVLAHAAPGDRLEVAGDRVNLRVGPGMEQPVIGRTDAGASGKEFARHAGWVHLDLDADDAPDAWIHQSLLRYADSGIPAGFEQFHQVFSARNRRAREATGETFFTQLRYLGPGRLQITASDVWLEQPEAGRRDNLRFIMQLWEQEHEADQPLAVYVVDGAGERRMQQTRPAS